MSEYARLTAAVAWASALCVDLAREHRAAGRHAESRALFKAARAITKHSREVVPSPNEAHWLGRSCSGCRRWFGMGFTCMPDERRSLDRLLPLVSPPPAEGASLDPHPCQAPLSWEWRGVERDGAGPGIGADPWTRDA